jgi:hypothetical protein
VRERSHQEIEALLNIKLDLKVPFDVLQKLQMEIDLMDRQVSAIAALN